ncbi:hydroxylamine reductase [Leptotrichia sp. OH3620_COT-345]|uniref:hydroxylamine reductase n=1 Tax=Leptotrichia sp. OH3620_COT-345 TaxID=2491048 RepID=UPI000F6469BD|nr:hydroxylamine reductase [Leptotrichia sp. OH3620_COT-345]RRD40975.1 hydroxylamine reductase [Leptotrichia sp. OH3620_COT-345]
MSMFCFQCQEAAKNIGCTVKGICGKTDEVSNLQDILVFVVKAVANYSSQLRKNGKRYKKVDEYLFRALFITITNANFDGKEIIEAIKEGTDLRNFLKNELEKENIFLDPKFEGSFMTTFEYTGIENIEEIAKKVGVLRSENEDVRSLREIILYGLKGMAAYGFHAFNLGMTSNDIYDFYEKALLATSDNGITAEKLTEMVFETGENGVKVMELLDKANTSAYGTPEMTEVNIGVGKNPGILISGHDLKDIKELLEQTEGTGIDVYTHSEMLPAHYYPELKKYKHLVGNYGNAWYHQVKEFETFNGPVVFTTNCIVPPKSDSTYNERIFTLNAAGYPGWKKLKIGKNGKTDYSEVIKLAKSCNPPTEIETGKITGGFAHGQVFALADKIVEAVKTGAIKKFIVMSGCDARMTSRAYYTEFAEKLPKDAVILTSGCAKFRYNKLKLGDINGIPRVLDAGQCNDSYSWAVVALKLKEIFNLNDINELPIEFNIAWYEQKAVIVLLALLYLGIKNIHIGPTLPAFVSPNVAKLLNEQFGLSGITNVENDLKIFFA